MKDVTPRTILKTPHSFVVHANKICTSSLDGKALSLEVLEVMVKFPKYPIALILEILEKYQIFQNLGKRCTYP